MPIRSALARFVTTPENESARRAIQDLQEALSAGLSDSIPNPLYLHGPPGSGKTLLVQALAHELMRHGINVCVLSGNDFAERSQNRVHANENAAPAEDADLLIIEDLQHLPIRYVEKVVQMVDEQLARGVAILVTATLGPGQVTHRGAHFPRRLTNRLAGGLVVPLAPLETTSRKRLLQELAKENEINISSEVLDWLAEHLTGGGRQLEGAIRQLKALQRLQKKPLRLEDLRPHFRAQIEAITPTVQRITEYVSGYYQVEPRQLLSDKRTHDVLVPRQVSMYLTRQLTKLSLQQIGRYFGGRDHKTVQHACKKVEAAMKSDRQLSGVVRKIRAELG